MSVTKINARVLYIRARSDLWVRYQTNIRRSRQRSRYRKRSGVQGCSKEELQILPINVVSCKTCNDAHKVCRALPEDSRHPVKPYVTCRYFKRRCTPGSTEPTTGKSAPQFNSTLIHPKPKTGIGMIFILEVDTRKLDMARAAPTTSNVLEDSSTLLPRKANSNISATQEALGKKVDEALELQRTIHANLKKKREQVEMVVLNDPALLQDFLALLTALP